MHLRVRGTSSASLLLDHGGIRAGGESCARAYWVEASRAAVTLHPHQSIRAATESCTRALALATRRAAVTPWPQLPNRIGTSAVMRTLHRFSSARPRSRRRSGAVLKAIVEVTGIEPAAPRIQTAYGTLPLHLDVGLPTQPSWSLARRDARRVPGASRRICTLISTGKSRVVYC